MFEPDEISLMVYPVETIFAEKLDAILCKGEANTRMKDFHDLFLLIRDVHVINKEKLKECIKSTFLHRKTEFKSIKFTLPGLDSLGKLWVSHLENIKNSPLYSTMPKNFRHVIEAINSFTENLRVV